MSGHSKWATIKRDKAVNDSKRSQIFTKISRLIMVAAKKGGGDPEANSSLRLALEKARDARMPKDNIEKAVAKGTGKGSDGANFEEITYEGYGPMGVAFMINATTDNRNRTVAEIRSIFSKHEGSLGTSGSTAYIFLPDAKTPNFFVDIDEEATAKTLNNLYDAFDDHDDVQEVFTNFRILG